MQIALNLMVNNYIVWFTYTVHKVLQHINLLKNSQAVEKSTLKVWVKKVVKSKVVAMKWLR